MKPLILASTSRYRAELLNRLRLSFSSAAPDVDESPLPGESPAVLAQRLAGAKAETVARQFPGSWAIGSDQVAELNGQSLGKPGSREAACAQLAAMSGHEVLFHTAVCVSDGTTRHQASDLTRVRFRALQTAEIERYIDTELPLDCAGSFKCEGLGITLFEAIENSDPTALIGLPLIQTARLLRLAGYQLP
ncbi:MULTISPECIES: Maf family nucleotide pyrophosphatase [Stenotrophomonas]|uniref:Maf family protein n=1 Tax=Stenotrophomonas TaxID=40323 RepID=UPI0007705C69|nr:MULTISPECIES: Maf family nucleotide pyrophosphatase [Stenotrophomonas]AMJ57386.1 septum formation inhibitor Maf [Stenotrophomonas sp. KCTC 12332]